MSQPSFSPDAPKESGSRAEAAAAGAGERAKAGPLPRPAQRIFVRGPWEMAASITIGVGVVMLMQPFFMWAYSWSFLVTLVGTAMFIVVSHFPE